MARRRFFVDRIHSGEATLHGPSADHVRRVLRARPGQRFEISDNRSLWLAELVRFGPQEVHFRLLEPLTSEILPVRLILLASLIKFDRFEWLIEKATELGVETIIPVAAARSEKGLEKAAAKRIDRWRRIALESSQQSRRSRLPQIAPCVPFAVAIKESGPLRYFLDEERSGTPLLAALPEASRRSPSDIVLLLIGPEGGWVDEERASAAASGWTPVSLGPLILRTETAGLAAVATLMSAWHMAGPPGRHGGACVDR